MPRLTYTVAVELAFVTVLTEAMTSWNWETIGSSAHDKQRWNSSLEQGFGKGINLDSDEQDTVTRLLEQHAWQREIANAIRSNEDDLEPLTTADEIDEGDWQPSGVSAIANDDEIGRHAPTISEGGAFDHGACYESFLSDHWARHGQCHSTEKKFVDSECYCRFLTSHQARPWSRSFPGRNHRL